ncbi:MAG: hypothetical protein U0169_00600 [Polyangiaceae bacterium]
MGLVLVSLLATSAARAEGPVAPGAPGPPATSPGGDQAADAEADEKAAGKWFADGMKAFDAGDFPRAAEAFEAAYAKKPHPSPLWNAARAWQRAGEPARAANAYAHFLRESPPSKDRTSAAKELERLALKLGVFDVHADGARDVTVDGLRTADSKVYVTPGSHSLEAIFPSGTSKVVDTVNAGDVRTVTLTAESPKSVVTPPPSDERTGSKPFTPALVLAGGALTAVGVGLAVASGIDTLAARDTFDSDPSPTNLASGRDKQVRTNVAIGVAGGLAILTAAAAVFLVDWSGPKKAATGTIRFGVGPASAAIGGSF